MLLHKGLGFRVSRKGFPKNIEPHGFKVGLCGQDLLKGHLKVQGKYKPTIRSIQG